MAFYGLKTSLERCSTKKDQVGKGRPKHQTLYEMSYNVVEEPANAGTSREAMLTTSPEGLKRMEDGSSSEEILAPQEMPRRFKAAAITSMILLVGAVALYVNSPCHNPLAFFHKSSNVELVEATQLKAAARHLKSVSSRKEADKMVAKAMHQAKEERIENHKLHKLPPLRTMTSSGFNSGGFNQFFHAEGLAVDARKSEVHDIVWTAKRNVELLGGSTRSSAQDFRQAFCVFNVAETVDSLGGTGIDVESIVRTCPEPRNDISEFACAVNAETLAEMVGSAATWLSSAVSTCDTFPNVGAECAAGVAGIVGALGEVAASGTLAMTSCKEFPMAGFRADSYNAGGFRADALKTDTLGNPTPAMSQVGVSDMAPPARRLFIGSGIGGMGVQCGVDVGFIVDNIYDTVFYIQQAVQLNSCTKRVRYGAYNYLTGVPEAACALDIAGAIAWITQIATFVQQLISHCPDLLELPTLCGSSITGMASSASQIASWGSQVAIACGEGESLALVSRVVVFSNDYSVVKHSEVGFVKLCSAALKSFDVECTWVTKANPDDFDGRKLPQVTLVGPYEGLLLAEAELNSTGLVLPHPFGTLNYETTIFRPRGTGVRRLEGEEVPTEASATWDPENHPSMRNLRIAMKELNKMRQNLTQAEDGESELAGNRATQANLQERLHLIEPALHEYSNKWSIEELDTC